jgi:hypothetical protein
MPPRETSITGSTDSRLWLAAGARPAGGSRLGPDSEHACGSRAPTSKSEPDYRMVPAALGRAATSRLTSSRRSLLQIDRGSRRTCAHPGRNRSAACQVRSGEERELGPRVCGMLHSPGQAEGSLVLLRLRHEHVWWERERPVKRGKHASADDRIGPRPAGRLATALATFRSPRPKAQGPSARRGVGAGTAERALA